MISTIYSIIEFLTTIHDTTFRGPSLAYESTRHIIVNKISGSTTDNNHLRLKGLRPFLAYKQGLQISSFALTQLGVESSDAYLRFTRGLARWQIEAGSFLSSSSRVGRGGQ